MAADAEPTSTEPTRPPVIGPGYTFTSVTEKISAIVLTRPTSKRWWIGFIFAFLLVMMLQLRHRLCCSFTGVGIWGINIPVGWGFAIVNFVWWIGIGHAGTLISAILLLLQAEMADLHQPLRRGHDAVRRGLRRPVPALAHGPAVVLLLAAALPQHDGAVAAVPQPARLGRVRRLHLRHGVAAVLVRRPDPRPRHAPRPRHRLVPAHRCTAFWRWAGAAPPPTGTATRPPICCWPAWRRRWSFRSIRWSASTSPSASCPAGTRPSSRPTSWPGPSIPASPWC